MRHTLLFILMFTPIGLWAQTQELSGKLSPALRQMVARQQTAVTKKAAAEPTTIEVLLKTTEGADETELIRKYSLTIERRIGRVLIVSLPATNVASLAYDSEVERVEAERMPQPMLDVLPSQIGSDRVNAGSEAQGIQAYTGKGVVVGIVDAGLDYVNPFFRDSSGETRVGWAADYMTNATYTSKEDVTRAMHSSDAATMLHGTHVAGIAAGSRVADINEVYYQGVAPESDIAMAAVNSEISQSGLSSTQALKAFSDIFAYASSQGKPCVINFSMGDAMSFVNNRQLEEEAIKTLLKEPGRAIVVAAGNSGGTSRLAHKPADMAEGGAAVWFNDSEQYGSYFGVELKVKPEQTVRLRYTNSTYNTTMGEQTISAADLETTQTITLGSKTATVQLRGKTDDGYSVFYITSGMTKYATSDRMLITISGQGDAWIYADALCAQLENVPTQYVESHNLAEQGYSMTWPAEMNEVIAVGNIAERLKIVTMANKYASMGGAVTPTDLTPYESTKGEGYLAKSSSVGPTLNGDNRIKPDVCAPGVNIVSAYNNFVNENTDMQYAAWLISILDTEYEPEYGGYFTALAQTGTSMSAPAVTGTIALWMQYDPTLTTERIKELLAKSSRQPDAELSYPNQQYGCGEIDAYRGLLYLIDPTGALSISRHQPAKAGITLRGRTLAVNSNLPMEGAKISVYTTAGQLVMTHYIYNENTIVSLDSLPKGIYAVQLSTADKATTGSQLIRID